MPEEKTLKLKKLMKKSTKTKRKLKPLKERKMSFLEKMLKKTAGTLKKGAQKVGEGAGAVYSAAKYGPKQGAAAHKLLTKNVERKMVKDGRRGIGAQEWSREAFKRRKALKEEIGKKLKY